MCIRDSVYVDQGGELWIGSMETGIDVYHITTNGKLITSDNVHPENANLYLNNTMIMTIYESNDRNEDIVWIGTAEKGLYKYSRSKNGFKHYENYFAKTTLAASVYYSILKDKNFLWAGTSKGMFRQNATNGHVEKMNIKTPDVQAEAFYTLYKDCLLYTSNIKKETVIPLLGHGQPNNF